MEHKANPPRPEPSGPPLPPRRRRPFVAALIGCAAILGVGSMAAAAHATVTPSGLASLVGSESAVAVVSDPSTTNCEVTAALTVGGATAASAAFTAEGPTSGDADEMTYRGRNVHVRSEGDRFRVGAMIADDAFLEIGGAAARQAGLLELMHEAIDRSDSWFDHDDEDDEDDVVLRYRGDLCDLGTAFDEDRWFEDAFRSDATVDFTSDEHECRFSSLFADAEKDDDFGFEDLDFGAFDLDFRHDEDGFSISLDTGDGTVGLHCADR